MRDDRFDLQLFGVHYDEYSLRALKQSIARNQKQLEEHRDKMNNPWNYVSDWENRGEAYQKGIVSYWRKEVENFKNQIRLAKEELDRRDKE